MRAATEAALDAERPKFQTGSRRINRLKHMAWRFALEGREDEAAARALRAAAGWHRKALRIAAAATRYGAWVGEDLLTYRADQLLQAAATGQPVLPVTQEQLAWFERIKSLNEGDRFARLVAARPELALVQRVSEDEAWPDSQNRIKAALTPLLGQASDAEDPLLRSHTAYDIAYQHLTDPPTHYEPPRQPVATVLNHTAAVTAVIGRFIDHHPVAVSAGVDHTARLWDLTDGTPRATLTGHTAPVTQLIKMFTHYHGAFTMVLVTAGQDSNAQVWHADTGSHLVTLTGHSGPITALAHARALPPGPPGGKVLRDLLKGTFRVRFATTTEMLVTASTDHTAKVWNLDAGTPVATLTGHTGPVTDVATGSLVVTASADHTARVWRIDTTEGKPVATLTGHTAPLRSVTCLDSGHDSFAVTGSDDHTARIWDLDTNRHRHTLTGHTGPVTQVQCTWHNDRPVVITCSDDGTARCWDATTGEPGATYGGHTGPVTGLVLAAGNVVTAGEDGTIGIADFKTGERRATLTGHDGPVTAIAVVTGSWIVTGGRDGTVRVWDTSRR